jgi:hypothetical protein
MTKPPAHLPQPDYAAVHTDIIALLESARSTAARSGNALMTASYWEIDQCSWCGGGQWSVWQVFEPPGPPRSQHPGSPGA